MSGFGDRAPEAAHAYPSQAAEGHAIEIPASLHSKLTEAQLARLTEELAGKEHDSRVSWRVTGIQRGRQLS